MLYISQAPTEAMAFEELFSLASNPIELYKAT
jgi:hypothetical protein